MLNKKLLNYCIRQQEVLSKFIPNTRKIPISKRNIANIISQLTPVEYVSNHLDNKPKTK